MWDQKAPWYQGVPQMIVYPAVEYVWIDAHRPFYRSLEFQGFSDHACYSDAKGNHYNMFMIDFAKATDRMGFGASLKGNFMIRKRGENFGIALVY